MEEENIYNMKLHQRVYFEGDEDPMWCLRVPGGWIYCAWHGSQPVFVPFSQEFNPNAPNKQPPVPKGSIPSTFCGGKNGDF